jgi:hypothetical protein
MSNDKKRNRIGRIGEARFRNEENVTLLAHLLFNPNISSFQIESLPKDDFSLRERILIESSLLLRKKYKSISNNEVIEILSDSKTFQYVGEDYLRRILEIDIKKTEKIALEDMEIITEQYYLNKASELSLDLESVLRNTDIDNKYEIFEIFLDTNKDENILNVFASVLNFSNKSNLEQVFEFKALKGSWIKKLIFKTKSKLTSKEAKENIKNLSMGSK